MQAPVGLTVPATWKVEVVNMDVWEEPPKVGPTKSLQFMNRDDLLEGDGDKAKKDHGKEENLEEMSEEEKAARNKAEFEKQSVLRQQRLYQGLLVRWRPAVALSLCPLPCGSPLPIHGSLAAVSSPARLP